MPSTQRSLASPRVVNIHDLRHLAQHRLPKVVFDYLDGGAESEVTLRENCRIFDDVTFRPRQAVAISECDLRTRVLSADLAFPAILAPIGYSRLMHPGGEIAAAAAAVEAGLAYTLSAISGHKLENVRAASKGSVWYQLYLVGGREVAEGAIDRARRAGFSALVVTIDTPVAGMRERDPRNGMKELLGGSIFSKLPFLPQMFTHPRWLVSFLLDGGVPKLENIVIPGKGPMSLIDVTAAVCPKNLVAFDFWCAVKSAGLLRVQVPPESWFAPLGSNRSGGGGNETAGASGVEGRYGDLASMQAVT